MTSFQLIQTLEILASISFLLWFYKGPWQKFMIDLTRQRLFEARDELFMCAAKGGIDFKSDSYKEIRDYLNTSIRICHRIGLRSLVASYISNPKVHKNIHNKNYRCILDATNVGNADMREKLREILSKSTSHIITMMMYRSIIAFIYYTAYFTYARLSGGYSKTILKMEHIIERDISMGDA